jgi:hypothetical protein
MFVRMQAREKSRMYYHNNKEALLKRRKERVYLYKLDERNKFMMEEENNLSLKLDILNI